MIDDHLMKWLKFSEVTEWMLSFWSSRVQSSPCLVMTGRWRWHSLHSIWWNEVRVRGSGCALTCTGCSLVLMLPTPSTVVTAVPCREHRGTRHAMTEKCLCMRNTENQVKWHSSVPWRNGNYEGWQRPSRVYDWRLGDCRGEDLFGGLPGWEIWGIQSPLCSLYATCENWILNVNLDTLNFRKSLRS